MESAYEVWVISPDAETNGATYQRQYPAHYTNGEAAVFDAYPDAYEFLARWENEHPMAWAVIYYYRASVGDFIDQSWRFA